MAAAARVGSVSVDVTTAARAEVPVDPPLRLPVAERSWPRRNCVRWSQRCAKKASRVSGVQE